MFRSLGVNDSQYWGRSPCEPGDDRRQSDLCAQWKAADAASRAALWAMWGTLVAAIGTAGLYWQIKLTREAVQDTGEATDAMREANVIAKEASSRATVRHRAALIREREADDERRAGERRQLRAYVDFKAVEQVTDDRPVKPQHSWHGVRVELWNYGQTPAEQLELKLVFFLKPKGGEATHTVEEIKTGLGGIMPKGHFHCQDFIQMSDDVWQSIADEKTELSVSIVATYKDAFGEPRVLASTYVANGWKTEMGFVAGTRITS